MACGCVTSTTNPIFEVVTVRHVHCFPFSHPAANTKMRSCEQKTNKKKQNFANVWLLCRLFGCNRRSLGNAILSVAPADKLHPPSSDVTRDVTAKLDEVPTSARYLLVAWKNLQPRFAEQLEHRQPQSRNARHPLSHITLRKKDLIWLCRSGHFHLAKCNQTQMSIKASRCVYPRRPNGRRYIQASVS